MSYILSTSPEISIPKGKGAPIIGEMLANYTGGTAWSIKDNNDKFIITIGNYTAADNLSSEYVINVTSGGVYIGGRDYSALMRGFITFLNTIKFSNGTYYVDECTLRDESKIGFRAAHLCIFPETKLDFFKKCVRACALVKFTHIIFEFWGMIKLDCMSELSWPFAYTKDEVREIVREANALGVEIIPTFNHLGHASGCRAISGKHVVLDQNPKYEYMYESHGWVWDFANPEVYGLLREIRRELTEVCGEGKYFHIGCDEAYMYGHDASRAGKLAGYVNRVAAELKASGRRTIMWHDMFLSHGDYPGYIANANKEVSDIILTELDKDIIVADWQYDRHGETWRTSPMFSSLGFDVVCCPWHNAQNISEAIETVKKNDLYGIIHTTWHTLHTGFPELIYAGVKSADGENDERLRNYCFYAAELARHALPSKGIYERAGWTDKTVGPGHE